MNIQTLRADIDRIDARILALLDERLEKALLTKKFKSDTADEKREEIVLRGISTRSRNLADAGFTQTLYHLILEKSRAVQDRGLLTIGFQGVHGAYGDMAAKAWNEQAATIPFHDFSQVFDAVLAGELDYGIVPVENTLGGIIGQVNSILVTTELRVVAAVDMPISHCLLAVPGQNHREIRTVYSHPQALAQCRLFLERNKLDAHEYFDTAASARMLAQEKPGSAAAIASSLAAELYGLEIIKEGIQDAPANRTRFFVLAKDGMGIKGSKCSAVFFADDKAGALFGALEVFAKAGINLTRIESVPDKPGDYAIFIDFEGCIDDAKVASAVNEVSKAVRTFRLLGCYEERKL